MFNKSRINFVRSRHLRTSRCSLAKVKGFRLWNHTCWRYHVTLSQLSHPRGILLSSSSCPEQRRIESTKALCRTWLVEARWDPCLSTSCRSFPRATLPGSEGGSDTVKEAKHRLMGLPVSFRRNTSSAHKCAHSTSSQPLPCGPLLTFSEALGRLVLLQESPHPLELLVQLGCPGSRIASG